MAVGRRAPQDAAIARSPSERLNVLPRNPFERVLEGDIAEHG
jgi:hypothetical protein